MRGFKTFAFGAVLALIAVLSNADMQAFIAEHIPSIGGGIGIAVIFLRAITSSAIFRDAGRQAPPKVLGMLLAGALVLPLLAGCGIAGQADTPMKKWAVAQEAHTAASDSLIGLIEAGQADKATAVRIDGWLDHAQDVLDIALTFIQAGEDASALTAILEATRIIDNIVKEIEIVTARNSGVIPWPDVSRVDPGRNGRIHRRHAGGLPGPRPDARGSPGDPDAGRRVREAA